MKPLFYYCILGKFHNIGVVWDKIAASEEYAIDFAHENINQEPKRFVNGLHFSLEYCLAQSGETINERYRHDRPEVIDLRIADMVASHATKVPLVLYRGVCERVFCQMRENAKSMKGVNFYKKREL